MARNKPLKARDIMTEGAKCVGEHESLQDAAKLMRELHVGALPICGDDDRLRGMVTDRDIVIQCVADGEDPAQVECGSLSGELHWIDADASATDALHLMEEHQVKRIPVIDVQNDHRLCGIISEANLAQNLTDKQIAEFASRVYAGAH
ncbi:CBS domain-containing protein [Streptomyces sp. NPDC052309]|uniref:CBS domain-containing protein n=1 Tax=Streptomyces griseicoloratus TaxID=2752516 RepID=A0A926L1U7_9ACTN|nr:CBS domain-containing protein [Streptomyces griseicoloratus]MBD0420061.1 CBS domain-containing protein [Streptomyces griseicoloratus]